jgi:hypothetical protein
MFVDAVIDDFVDEVMEAVCAGAADVHRRSFPNGIEALQDLDLIRTIAL